MKTLTKFERIDAEFLDFLHIIYYINGTCKFNCDYCFVLDNRKKNENLEGQYKIINTLFKLKTPFDIYLYGGEPTEYKYIHEVIQYTLNKPPSKFRRIELQTNLNITREEIKTFCQYDNLVISPSLHINFLKGDTIYDLIDKLDIIYSHGRLERVDYMLERESPDLHYELNDILKKRDYYDKVLYTFNYMEINKDDIYTGGYNTLELYRDIVSNSANQEAYKLTYDDGTEEEVDISDLYLRNMSFKDWYCDAGRYVMFVEYTGDWWLCDTKYVKEKPMGNLLESPAKFLIQTRAPFKCNIDKCDGCYYINKEKKFK